MIPLPRGGLSLNPAISHTPATTYSPGHLGSIGSSRLFNFWPKLPTTGVHQTPQTMLGPLTMIWGNIFGGDLGAATTGSLISPTLPQDWTMGAVYIQRYVSRRPK